MNRYLGSQISVIAMVACIVAAVAINDYRMRNYVEYPWLEDKDRVIKKLDDIDQRLQTFERRIVLLLDRERPPFD